MAVNKYLASETKGLDSFVEQSGATTFGPAFSKLRELIEQEHTQEHRGHLDQISPAAHRQLIRELDYLESLAAGLADGTATVVTHGQSIPRAGGGTAVTAVVAAGVITITVT